MLGRVPGSRREPEAEVGTIDIRYVIRLDAEREEVFDVRLDEHTLEIDCPACSEAPAWTALEFEQCPNCPLDPATDPQCPLAVAIAGIVQRFDDVISYDEVDLDVELEDRHVSARTTSQRALRSLLGLVMAGSGCPHTAFFKPMARFHLPLASESETLSRAVGTWLTAQYLEKARGGDGRLDLAGLDALYREMQVVNVATAARLRAATKTDSALNAVALLDLYAQAVPFSIAEKLAELRAPYDAFLGDAREHDG